MQIDVSWKSLIWQLGTNDSFKLFNSSVSIYNWILWIIEWIINTKFFFLIFQWRCSLSSLSLLGFSEASDEWKSMIWAKFPNKDDGQGFVRFFRNNQSKREWPKFWPQHFLSCLWSEDQQKAQSFNFRISSGLGMS